MSLDSGRKLYHSGSAPPPPETEPLPCPRCDSTNTKFCYYNNYNLAQPRHFCKGCRRYWTQGGALRNIPIGGGTRKNHAKRCRTSSSVSSTTSSSASQDHYQQQQQQRQTLICSTPITATPISCITTTTEPDSLLPIDLNSVSGGFTSLLNTQNPSFLALGGFGLGIGSGYDDMGFDISRGVWPLGEISGESNHHHGNDNGGGVNGVSASLGGGHSWQLGTGISDGVFGEPDCFAWPDLSISTPCKEVK